ncbi:putative urease accessory protein [Phaeomoniella chlamydospora]|uniref:Putative urease accessory protein n=1 Tax=Phaeomoniella chlamydospora TaxID=158046 RepID=A0A0G2GFF2_PHACM|nr:putative urease accessory protein [Phaeomoniella chlamydospora]
MNTQDDQKTLTEEYRRLEVQLEQTRRRLENIKGKSANPADIPNGLNSRPYTEFMSDTKSIHALLLLSDSALPLGSFAYSSGLESFLSHRKHGVPPRSNTPSNFQSFLHLSLSSVSYTNVPYLLAAHRSSRSLQDLDNDLDASTPCTVARRASIAQGRALLGVWERSFRSTWNSDTLRNASEVESAQVLRDFSQAMKVSSDVVPVTTQVNGHFAPLWGATAHVMGLDSYQAAYVFLINHAKAVLSAAVRASVMGPYQAQGLLAGKGIQQVVAECIQKVWDLSPENAGQVVPALDLWVGRHELLYSRIFNS